MPPESFKHWKPTLKGYRDPVIELVTLIPGLIWSKTKVTLGQRNRLQVLDDVRTPNPPSILKPEKSPYYSFIHFKHMVLVYSIYFIF